MQAIIQRMDKNKVLLYSTGNYTQLSTIPIWEKEL